MNWIVAFFLGIILGYALEWLVDFLYLRRKTRLLQQELDQTKQEKSALEEQLNIMTAEAQAGIEELPEAPMEWVPIPVDELTEEEEVQILEPEAVEVEEDIVDEVNDLGDEEVVIDEEIAFTPDAIDEDEIPPTVIELSSEGDRVEEIVSPVEESDWGPEEPLPTDGLVEEEIDLSSAKFKQDIEFVEGIGPAYGERLHEIGIDNPKNLLERGSTPKGRAEIVGQTGIPGTLILKWVNQVDLYRIKGIGSEYAELLEVAGVDTVKELALRNSENLYAKLLEINEEHKNVRQLPSHEQVADWIYQAKTLPRVLSY
jgi:predicted flap endonuclease-1-like 5' DNA nuclease